MRRVSIDVLSASMPELRGFLAPRSPEGAASLVPAPPWHYSGDVLTLEYRAAAGSVARWLPNGLEPAADDPDAVAVVFADWQSCSAGGDELVDPVRSQYKEAFIVVRCRHDGVTYSRCILIWVDKDFALARGWFQGYPKKLGSIWMTRPTSIGKAGPRLEPGGRIGATLAANDRRLIDVVFTIEGNADTAGFVNALPMLHSRWMPAIDGGGDALDELVVLRSQDVEVGPAYTGSFELELHDAPGEELTSLAPVEPIAAYWRQVAATFVGGERV
jgi:acetoacetate decarboxylase